MAKQRESSDHKTANPTVHPAGRHHLQPHATDREPAKRLSRHRWCPYVTQKTYVVTKVAPVARLQAPGSALVAGSAADIVCQIRTRWRRAVDTQCRDGLGGVDYRRLMTQADG